MAIDRVQGVKTVTVGDLEGENLQIPPYQRPYRWTPTTALQLLDDIFIEFKGSKASASSETYVLGAVILHREPGKECCNVVDGQQRLLTLTMLLEILDHRADDRAPEDTGSTSGADTLVGPDTWEEVDHSSAVVEVYRSLANQVSHLGGDAKALAAFVRGSCILIRIETDDADEAFRVFDSQNYRGKSLLPHDLLKAYHLREVSGESDLMKIALVDAWESVPAVELDRLFSTYLWRIRQWSRGRSAPPFSSKHVEAYKGITSRTADSPTARYHLAAQAAVPMLAAWDISSNGSERAAVRSRFQLDAPVQAGRPFFEMVSFMLAELKTLRIEAYSNTQWSDFVSSDADMKEQPSKFKFRYVSELYIAALLYYTNKFGSTPSLGSPSASAESAELREAKNILFTWAYGLRTRLLSVQMVSVNNHARDVEEGMSAFVLLRNADRSEDLRKLARKPLGRDDRPGHMKDLVELLDGIEE